MLRHWTIILFAYSIITIDSSLQSGYGPWILCSSPEECFVRREKIFGNGHTGVENVNINGVYEERVTGSECETCNVTSDWSNHLTTFQACQGSCYDATNIMQVSCISKQDCLLLYYMRCYNGGNCSGIWTATSTSTPCSATCGGGTQLWEAECRNPADNTSFHNCNGTMGTIDVPSTVTLPCNTHSCPEWSSWTESTSCSVTCGNGTLLLESICYYQGNQSTGCEGSEGLYRRTRLDSCNATSCREWSQWTTCDSCSVGERTRRRTCTSLCAQPAMETSSTSCSAACNLTTPSSFIDGPYFLPVVAGGGGFVALLVVIIIIICLLVRRRRRNKNSSSESVSLQETRTSTTCSRHSVTMSTISLPTGNEYSTINDEKKSVESSQMNTISEYAEITERKDNKKKLNQKSTNSEKKNDGMQAVEADFVEEAYAEISRDRAQTAMGVPDEKFTVGAPDSQQIAAGDRRSVASYIAMNSIIPPKYTSLHSDPILMHGSLAPHANSDDCESWVSSSSTEDAGPSTLVSSGHALNLRDGVRTQSYRDPTLNQSRSSTNSSGKSEHLVLYSTVDPKQKKIQFMSKFASGNGTSPLRASNRAPVYSAIKKGENAPSATDTPLEGYETMKTNVMVESAYEINSTTYCGEMQCAGEIPPAAKAPPEFHVPPPPPTAEAEKEDRAPMPIPKRSTPRAKVNVPEDAEYARINDDGGYDNWD